ncbi:MAG: leucine-rich repeat domain-containing protein, partial [Caldilineaceae bacterium]|nr:leucine-rich repeat domain-containing protein [Caldilineaceae bacterium]
PDTFGNLGNLGLLDLSGNSLRTLPESFGNLQNLRWLILRSNQLNTLPTGIGNLSNLIFLDLSYNNLTALPAAIDNLTGLERLQLDNNQLQSVPAAIGNLSTLNTLELNANQLTFLPPEIGKLTKLTVLKLARNQLVELPAEIGNLTALLDIQLYANQLTGLPDTIEQLDAIPTLELQGNHFAAYPAAINGMANLETVWLNDNDLQFLPVDLTLPPKLTRLALTENRELTGPIPQSFTQLTAFEAFYTDLCADDDAEFQQWLDEATGGDSGYLQPCPALQVDVTEGAPGSQFTLVGVHFGTCCITWTVTVTVNSEVLGTFLAVNGAPFTATLTTSDTVEGHYIVSAAYGLPGWTYGYAPQITLAIAADAPLNSPTPVPLQFALPPTSIYQEFIYLPLLAR